MRKKWLRIKENTHIQYVIWIIIFICLIISTELDICCPNSRITKLFKDLVTPITLPFAFFALESTVNENDKLHKEIENHKNNQN